MRAIQVRRDRGYYGMIRSLELIVDGFAVGKIEQGHTIGLQVPENARHIWGRMDWGETTRLELPGEGATVVFQGYFTLNPLRNLGVQPLPFRIRVEEKE